MFALLYQKNEKEPKKYDRRKLKQSFLYGIRDNLASAYCKILLNEERCLSTLARLHRSIHRGHSPVGIAQPPHPMNPFIDKA
jgi:hypothetical protein